MPRLEVRLELGQSTHRVGTLLTAGPRVFFEYDPAFLTTRLEISPYHLGLRPGVFDNSERHYDGLWGAFDDSLPDTWGLLLIRREFIARGIDPDTLTPLALLRYLGTRTVGALTYHPPEHPEEADPTDLALDEAAAQAIRIYEGSAEDVLPALRAAGGPSGGARPKALVAVREDGHMLVGSGRVPDGYRHYLVKFPTRDEYRDVGLVELAYATMARAAGIRMPPTRRFSLADGVHCFAVERFDRDPAAPNLRRHLHSLGGLLLADYRDPACDYLHLLKVTEDLTRDHSQVVEAFRRMVFNVLAGNRDDHVKNFAFLMDEAGTWELSPAYDLMYEPRTAAYEHHVTSVRGVSLHPRITDVLGVADEMSIAPATARAIVEEVAEAVAAWDRLAAEADVSPARTAQVRKQLAAIRQTFGATPIGQGRPKRRRT